MINTKTILTINPVKIAKHLKKPMIIFNSFQENRFESKNS